MVIWRTVSTALLLVCWLLVIAGVMIYHVAVSRVLPPLQDLPENVATGFGELLGFDYLEQDARLVQDSAATALTRCNVSASAACPTYQPIPVPGSSNTSAERQAIVDAFGHSLGTILRVADDQYFGTGVLRQTARGLGNITADLARLNDIMACAASNAIFCSIYEAGGTVLSQVQSVRAEIDRFKGSKEVEIFEYAVYFCLLYILPYFLVVSMIFLTCFWAQGGDCYGSSRSMAVCTAILFALFLIVAFALMTTVVVAGRAVARADAAEVHVTQLRGDPTVVQLLGHIEANFPEVWDLVFSNFIRGLSGWVGASAVLLAICIIVMLYSCCLCCCRPYHTGALLEES
uniref:Uncharacterized protein n=1 Tax=Alexandrium monilatum TaxID=311494 RepID=A0A7S4UWV5_9DINO